MRVLRAVLILIIINTSICHAWDKQADPPPANVAISNIVFQTLAQNRPFVGTLYYDRISHVSSEVPGLVTHMDMRTGDRVEKGAVLVRLDTAIREKEISIQKNQIEQAGLRISHLQKNHQRMDSLYKKGGVSEKEYDDAAFVYQDALLQKKAAETMLEKLLIQQQKSVIRAPFDGILLEKNVDSADWVTPGKHLVSIGSVNDLFIRVSLAETLLKFVHPGDRVPVTITAYNDEIVGTIDNLSPIADAKTKNVFIKIKIPMLDRVAQNMSASVYIPTGTRQKLAMIPRDALFQFQGNDFVYTIKEKRAVQLPVNIVTYQGSMIGADNDHFTEGMPVIVEGNERLRPDQRVAIVGAN